MTLVAGKLCADHFSMDVTSPVARALFIVMGAVFVCVGVVAFFAGSGSEPTFVRWAMPPLFIAAGLWMVSSGLVSIRVSPGESVGGGPLVPSVRLDPGETVLADSPALYQWEQRRPFSIESYQSVYGHVFVTDRHIIFTPWRFRFTARALALAYSDMTVLTGIQRFKWNAYTNEALSIRLSDATEHTIWLTDRDARTIALATYASAPAISTTLLPTGRETVRGALLELVLAVAVIGAIVALLGGTGAIWVFGMLAFVIAAAVWQFVSILRSRRREVGRSSG
jgi:hypothetical protein